MNTAIPCHQKKIQGHSSSKHFTWTIEGLTGVDGSGGGGGGGGGGKIKTKKKKKKKKKTEKMLDSRGTCGT